MKKRFYDHFGGRKVDASQVAAFMVGLIDMLNNVVVLGIILLALRLDLHLQNSLD